MTKNRISRRDGITAKIKTLGELKKLLPGARKKGRRIALCHGVFDLLHPGHIVHFREARRHGDILIVTVTPDRYVNKGPGRPLFTEQLRMQTLAAIDQVDYVALNEWPTAVETIKTLRPDRYIKGKAYSAPSDDLTGKIVDEETAVRSVGGELVFTDGFTSSSSHLINRFFSVYSPETQEYLQDFRSRHNAGEIIDHLNRLRDLKVLVVGEAILDQYCYCEPVGKSPKQTVVSTKFLSQESFAGGAIATANHVAGFCKSATLLTTLGPDASEEEFIRSKLRRNTNIKVVRTEDRPTVRKRRFLEPSFMGKMFEMQYLDDSPIRPQTEKRLLSHLDDLVKKHDMVVVNDFGHGMLTETLRQYLSSCGKFLALNTQSNSANHGFNTATNYSRADYVALDCPELHLASRNKYGDILALSKQIRTQLQAEMFLVSLGQDGCAILSSAGWHESPALATRVVDRIGAGDALFAVTSPCAFRGVPPEIMCFIGNCVGAMAVEIVCNRESIDPVGLHKFIDTLLK
ncbi:PfkB family carbohydrate kinase [Elusimicrobiota bacterium]